MFENSGKNLMRLSRAFLAVCLALTVAGGILAWVRMREASASVLLCVPAFLAILAAGGFLSWTAASALYAFGQMSEDLHQLRMDRALEGGSGGHSSSYAKAGYTLPGQTPPARQRRSQAGRERREAAQPEQRPESAAWTAAAVPQTDMIGRSGWIQADSIYIQCPCCGSRMTPEFAAAHHGCPQCKTPYQP